MAATYYVDGDTTCAAGNGTSITCGANGPKRTIAEGIALMSPAGGDTLNVRGAHGSFNGVYRDLGGEVNLKNKMSGANSIIQAYGWTAVGAQTEERVIIQGDDSSVTWVQCSTCASGICSGVPGTCGHTYYVVGAENYTNPRFAVQADGSPTVQVATAAAMTNATSGYVTARCTLDTWKPCYADRNCTRTGDTCNLSAAATEIDSYADGTNLLVRWGAGGPPAGAGVVNSHGPWGDGNGFTITTGTNNLTVRGFIMRNFTKPAFSIFDGSHDINIVDNKVYFVCYNNGADYAINPQSVISNIQNILIDYNEIAFVCSEMIHTHAREDNSATNFDITRNYLWGGNDPNVMGPLVASLGTAQGMIIADDYVAGTNGNYSGSTIDSNVLDLRGTGNSTTNWVGIRLENDVSNIQVSNNVMHTLSGTGVFLSVEGGPISSNSIFNNLIILPGQNANQDYLKNGITFGAAADGILKDANLIFNNTIINAKLYALGLEFGTNNPTNTLVKNNILFNDTGAATLVNWPSSTASNVYLNNLSINTALSAGTNIVNWKGSNYSCTSIGSLDATNKCSNPLFANTTNNDYHIQTSSPAKDAGTSTGMPSGRTRDINNTVASSHNLPAYSDNQAQSGSAWDMGVDEFSSGTTVDMKISKTDSPDPVVAGNNITYTISYSNASTTSATGVVITDTVPANTSFVSANNGGAVGAGVVTWDLGTVVGGGAGTVQLVVAVTSPLANGTIILNQYSISSAEQGTVTGLAASTTVTSSPFLVLGKSDTPDPVVAGSNILYTISYSNTGTAGATGVVITDTVPVNTTFVSATNGGIQSGGVVTWTVGPVNAGAAGTVSMTVQVGGGVANGTTITNSTYSMASNELATVIGAPISTSVQSASPTTPVLALPITQRQNAWSATQTDTFGPNAHITQGPNGSQFIEGYATEEITLSTSGTTTDSSANLLPANAIIAGVTARVTTTITVATDWKVGDATQAARFCSANATLASGTTSVCLNQADPTVATANLGPVQVSAAKVRITTTGTPGAGKIRITVFYRQMIPPGS